MKELGNTDKQEVRRWANNRVEDSHLPFRRRERAMLRFRRMNTLRKFASVHANVHNHFNLERHLVDRQAYKDRRSPALAEWQKSRELSRRDQSPNCITWRAVRVRLTAPPPITVSICFDEIKSARALLDQQFNQHFWQDMSLSDRIEDRYWARRREPPKVRTR